MASRAFNDNGPDAERDWFTAAELAVLGLPGLPRDKRSINRRAQEERWPVRRDRDGALLVRPRAGRGGGVEFHVSLLPPEARLNLVRRAICAASDPSTALHSVELCEQPQRGLWRWYEAQSAKVHAEAQRRLELVDEIALLEESGMTRTAAIADVAGRSGSGKATLWSWLRLADGIAQGDRLPALAPRRTGGGAEAAINETVWLCFKSDYLRPEKPTLASCYYRAEELAASRGVTIPHRRTFQRRIEREIDPRLIIARREGADALRRSMPPQRRSVAHLHALEMVNIDGHKFDVFVRTPEGRVIRPMMVAIQDIHSRKFLAWRIDESENSVVTRLAFADLFRDYGIPKACVLDNGRAFASKWITGGAKSRFRFKIREDEPTGLLTSLGIAIHWALPFRGQSKPIERGFRDLCDTIAKHPLFAGAYTGNKPDAKPENYGDRAIDWTVFCGAVTRGIAAHNARSGRRTEIANGRSFDDVFAESYATAPIGKATPEQLRLALLAADQQSVCRRTGMLTLHGNRYWSPQLAHHHGQKVTVRFDPEALHQPLHVYDIAGRYIASADLIEDVGFDNVAAAKKRARQEADLRKAVRAAEDMEQLLTAGEVAAQLPDYIDEPILPEPRVVRPVRHRGQTAAALRPEIESRREPCIDRFAAAVGRLRVVE